MYEVMRLYWRSAAGLLRAKSFTVPLLLITALAHGCRVFSYCLGLDSFDHFSFNHYCNVGYYVSQNRWFIGLLGLILGCGQEVPFYSNFLLVLLLLATSLLLCVFIKRVDDSIRTSSLMIFGCIFISFPIYGETLMYPSAVVDVCGYLLVTVSVIALYEGCRSERGVGWTIVSLAFLVCALSIYESNIILHAVLVFSTLILTYRRDRVAGAGWLFTVLKYGLFLFCAVALLYVVGYGLMAITGVSASSVSSRTIAWLAPGLFGDKLLMLAASVAGGYVYFGLFYYPLFAFNVVAAIALVGGCVWGVRSKSWTGLLLITCLLASNLSLSLLQGIMTPYRAASGLGVSCAILMLLGIESVRSERRRTALFVVLAYVAFFQAKELTLWTWNDLHTFDLDVARATLLGHDLEQKYGVAPQTPVLFVGSRATYPYTRLYSKSAFDMGFPRLFDVSPLCNGESYFMRDNFRQTEREFIALLKYCGYEYRRASLEQRRKIAGKQSIIDSSPIWPQEGAIVELEDCIVVHLGANTTSALGRRELLKRRVKELLHISPGTK